MKNDLVCLSEAYLRPELLFIYYYLLVLAGVSLLGLILLEPSHMILPVTAGSSVKLNT